MELQGNQPLLQEDSLVFPPAILQQWQFIHEKGAAYVSAAANAINELT